MVWNVASSPHAKRSLRRQQEQSKRELGAQGCCDFSRWHFPEVGLQAAVCSLLVFLAFLGYSCARAGFPSAVLAVSSALLSPGPTPALPLPQISESARKEPSPLEGAAHSH